MGKGSDLHQSGTCRPCAWYWKPQGRRDGVECTHCHLCPKDAMKKRKEHKATVARAANNSGAEKASPIPTLSNNSEITQASLAPTRNDESQSSACDPLAGLPSKGSELHGTGACKPCSWFWKPGGCQNKAECLHCHLCPADEQERRKKAKNLSMRSREKRSSVDVRRSSIPDAR